MKRTISFMLVFVLLIGVMSVAVYAHGYHGGGGKRALVCTAENCVCLKDGTRAVACTVDDCAVLGLHEHDSVLYRCANSVASVSRHGCGRR